MLTARQFAEARNVAYTTVINWLNKTLLPGAEKEELAYGGFMWLIPENAIAPELKPGPKAKKESGAKPAKKARKKGSDQ